MYIKTYWVKTYGIKEMEVLTGDWEDLNKETYACNVCLQNVFTTSRFTSARKHKPINLLTFIFARRYSPSEKQPIDLFTQFWKFSDFKSVKIKDWCSTDFIYYCNGKIWSNSKIRKTFLVSCNFDCLYLIIFPWCKLAFWWLTKSVYPKCHFVFLINWSMKFEIKFWFSFLYWSWDRKHQNQCVYGRCLLIFNLKLKWKLKKM